MTDDNLRVETADGWSLSVAHTAAVGTPIAAVVLGHAMFCNRRTLDRPPGGGLASVLSSLGLDVWTVDLRAHGLSGPSASRDVDYTYDDFINQDIPAVVNFVAERTAPLPLFVVGHSLTAHAAVASKSVHPELPVAGIVSIGGGVWIESLEPNPVRWALKRAALKAWALVTSRAGYFPAKRMGLGNENEAKSYVAQFEANAQRDRWASADGETDYLVAMRTLDIPILSIVGDTDRMMCHPVAAREWLAHASGTVVTHRIIGTQLGDPRGIDHMGLVLDPKMRPVWREIPAWIQSTLPSNETRLSR